MPLLDMWYWYILHNLDELEFELTLWRLLPLDLNEHTLSINWRTMFPCSLHLLCMLLILTICRGRQGECVQLHIWVKPCWIEMEFWNHGYDSYKCCHFPIWSIVVKLKCDLEVTYIKYTCPLAWKSGADFQLNGKDGRMYRIPPVCFA